MISVERIAAVGLLLVVGACSRLPNVPTAYSALPATALSGPVSTLGSTPVAAAAAGPAMPAEAAVDLPRIVIPGTLTIPVAAVEPRGMNPNAALDASRRTRMTWEALRPADLMRPSGATKPGATAATVIATPNYDREAMMDRLLKGGRNAGTGICSGC